MIIKAVIFDRDGVLTDIDLATAVQYFQSLLPISIEALQIRFTEWGIQFGHPTNNEEETQFWVGFWETLADELELSADVRQELHQFNYTKFMKPFPEARQAMLVAKEYGLKIGVLSNFKLASLPASLTAVGLAEFVDEACAAPVIGVSKPDPQAYLTIAKRLNVSPESCLFFDDIPELVNGAKAVGMHAYLVDRMLDKHDIQAHTVHDLSAVASILQEMATKHL